jgi:hypothetical protein
MPIIVASPVGIGVTAAIVEAIVASPLGIGVTACVIEAIVTDDVITAASETLQGGAARHSALQGATVRSRT